METKQIQGCLTVVHFCHFLAVYVFVVWFLQEDLTVEDTVRIINDYKQDIISKAGPQ